MKVVGWLVVVAISIGSSVVAAPSSNSAASVSASADSNSELERRKLGYAAVELNATATLPYYFTL